jgi:hypothetical protein
VASSSRPASSLTVYATLIYPRPAVKIVESECWLCRFALLGLTFDDQDGSP